MQQAALTQQASGTCCEGGRSWLVDERRRPARQRTTPKRRGPPGDSNPTKPATVVAVGTTRTIARRYDAVVVCSMPPLIPAIFAQAVPDPIIGCPCICVLASVRACGSVVLTHRSINVEALQQNGCGALKRCECEVRIFEV